MGAPRLRPEENEKLRQELRSFLKAQSMESADFARMVADSPNTVRSFLTGKRGLSPRRAAKFRKTIGAQAAPLMKMPPPRPLQKTPAKVATPAKPQPVEPPTLTADGLALSFGLDAIRYVMQRWRGLQEELRQ